MSWLNKKNKIYLNNSITHNRKYRSQYKYYNNNSRDFSHILVTQIIYHLYNRVRNNVYKIHK